MVKKKKEIKKTKKIAKKKVINTEEPIKLSIEQRDALLFAMKECANFGAKNCIMKWRKCSLITGESCSYYTNCVLPLMQYTQKKR